MGLFTNVGGQLKELSSLTTTVGGEPKEINSLTANIGGQPKEIFTMLPKSDKIREERKRKTVHQYLL